MGEEVASGLGSRVPVQRGLVLLTAVARLPAYLASDDGDYVRRNLFTR